MSGAAVKRHKAADTAANVQPGGLDVKSHRAWEVQSHWLCRHGHAWSWDMHRIAAHPEGLGCQSSPEGPGPRFSENWNDLSRRLGSSRISQFFKNPNHFPLWFVTLKRSTPKGIVLKSKTLLAFVIIKKKY